MYDYDPDGSVKATSGGNFTLITESFGIGISTLILRKRFVKVDTYSFAKDTE